MQRLHVIRRHLLLHINSNQSSKQKTQISLSRCHSTTSSPTTSKSTDHNNHNHNNSNNNSKSQMVHEYFQNVKSYISDTHSDYWHGTVRVPKLFESNVVPQPSAADVKIPDVIISELCSLYIKLNLEEKEKYLSIMTKEFGVNEDLVWKELEDVYQHKDIRKLHGLRAAMVPLYERFIDNLIKQPNGMQFVVNMRKDLLEILQQKRIRKEHISPDIENLEKNLHEILTSWFSLAFLKLKELTWDSPISILEKIMKAERVHQFGSIDPTVTISDPWQDLKRRVAKSSSSVHDKRRLFCFVHPNMETEPLIFVHVAFLNRIPHTMREVLPREDSSDASNSNTAIFYSISASQVGLRGIELGNFLIKRVVKEIQLTNQNITTFCTLSPIPTFASWLFKQLNNKDEANHLLNETDRTAISKLSCDPSLTVSQSLATILQSVQQNQTPIPEELTRTMLRIATRYLYLERKKDNLLSDPVANFHIRNGARMYRVNINADFSSMRMKESFGMMVNYQYVLDEIQDNNRDYILDGSVKTSAEFVQCLEE